MRYSPESLKAFVQTVESGSFSAAARTLRKSQSTISAAVASLEADIGFTLFNRDGRQPILTEKGKRVLAQVREILHANASLNELAVHLTGEVEACLRIAISDFWQTEHLESLLRCFSRRYPVTDLECMVAEDEDVVDLLQTARAHIAVVRTQRHLPADLASSRLKIRARLAVYIHNQHPLARQRCVSQDELRAERQLWLSSWTNTDSVRPAGKSWSAPSWPLLLEMAELGFGWSILPCWMVKQFGHQLLVQLPVAGWPQEYAMDALWSKRTPPGQAGRWMIDQLCVQQMS